MLDRMPEARSFRGEFLTHLDAILEGMEKDDSMDTLDTITGQIFKRKSDILGQMALAVIRARYSDLVEQEFFCCPGCKRDLKSRGVHVRVVETMAGEIPLERPYFYCTSCKQGFYPLDDALQLSRSSKQYDLQDLSAWLGSELPFEVAAKTLERCTGTPASAQNVHECTNRMAEDLQILDVCPSKEEIEKKIHEVRGNKFRRPVMMLGLDGGHTPTRPEPSPREGRRGKGEWKEAKGFRLYLIDEERIVPLICWHRIGKDRDLASDLLEAKEAGLIPQQKARLCVIGDGAPWIWNRIKEIFPTAKEVLDYYHCSEHLHDVAHAQYGKNTREAQEWVESSLARLFHNQARHVIAGLKRMKPSDEEAKEKIEALIRYLSQHKKRIDYGAARRGGYHIGSGAMESQNKFIAHVRLKRSGAWWYPTHANNILKLRCAKHNGTYDRIMAAFKEKDQEKLREVKRLQRVQRHSSP